QGSLDGQGAGRRYAAQGRRRSHSVARRPRLFAGFNRTVDLSLGPVGSPRRRRLRSAHDGAGAFHARRGPGLLAMGFGRGAAKRALGRVFRRLVDFDNVAVRIVEKDLSPARHRPVAIVRIFDAFFLETSLEYIEVVGAKSDVGLAARD